LKPLSAICCLDSMHPTLDVMYKRTGKLENHAFMMSLQNAIISVTLII
jgi:hypothetical protein